MAVTTLVRMTALSAFEQLQQEGRERGLLVGMEVSRCIGKRERRYGIS